MIICEILQYVRKFSQADLNEISSIMLQIITLSFSFLCAILLFMHTKKKYCHLNRIDIFSFFLKVYLQGYSGSIMFFLKPNKGPLTYSSLSLILAFWEAAFFNIYFNIYIFLITNSS